MNFRIGAVCATLLALWPLQAAGEAYPTRPITLIVPLAPGGAMDVIARSVAQKLGERLGSPLIIENRAGGGTLVGATAAAKAAPDGYTLFAAPSGTLATNPTLYKKLPYGPVADFAPISLYTRVPFVLVINPSLPIHSLAELVRYAKKKPGKLSYGSPGIGTTPHLAAEMLMSMAGIDMIHVPYRGSPPALSDTVAGHVQMTFADPVTTPQLIESGQVRALGVTSLDRVAILPNVPTFSEAGLPGFQAMSWHVLAAPVATPPEITARLHDEMKAVMTSPDIRKKISDAGLIPVDSPASPEVAQFIKHEAEIWGQLVTKLGLAGSQN